MNRQERRSRHRELRKAVQAFHAGRINKAQLDAFAKQLGFENRHVLSKRVAARKTLWGKTKAFFTGLVGARA